MNKYLNILVSIIFLMSFGIRAQDLSNKKLLITEKINFKSDSIAKPISAQGSDSLKQKPFKPDVKKVVWMGAIIPGYGQILNKKYWKLPIVYGGFLGFAYAISWNSSQYMSYKAAYQDIIDTDPNTNSFMEIIPKGYTIASYGGVAGYTNILKSAQDNTRRYRDLSIIFAVAYYAITMVDAFVDAQLYDFDISPDLTMRFQPTLIKNSFGKSNSLGVQFCISLK